MIANPAQAAQVAQKLSDGQLRQIATGASPLGAQFPLYVAAAEIQRRADLRRSMQGMQAMAAGAQDKSVLEELLDGTPIDSSGGVGTLPAMTDQSTGQPSSLMQQQPQGQPMQPKGYAGGGVVALDDGGTVGSDWRALSKFYRSGNPFEGLGNWFRGGMYAPGAIGGAAPYPFRPETVESISGPLRTSARDLERQNENYVTDENGYPVRMGDAVRGLPPLDVYTPPKLASAEGGGGSSTVTSRGPSSSVSRADMPSFLKDSMESDRGLASFLAERQGLMPGGQALEGLQGERDTLADTISKRREGSKGEALLQAGAAMAASRSPYFMQAVGEGGLAGLRQYTDERKDIDKLQQLSTQYTAAIDQARRHEAVGNVDAAAREQQHAQTIRATYVKAAGDWEEKELTSRRALEGSIIHSDAIREYHRASAEGASEARLAAIRGRLYTNAVTMFAQRLKNDPRTIMLPDEEIQRRAQEEARTYMQHALPMVTGEEAGEGVPSSPRLDGKVSPDGRYVPNR